MASTKVFLSYARNDIEQARRLRRDLRRARDVDVWFDEEQLIPGMTWRPAVRKAIRESDFFLALLSKSSVLGRGYRHTELNEALEVVCEFPNGKVFLIPVRLDECEMPADEMERYQYCDLFGGWKNGVSQLISAFDRMPKTAEQKIATTFNYTVGIADAGNELPVLSELVSNLNRRQSFFQFKVVQTAEVGHALVPYRGHSNLAIHHLESSFFTKYDHFDVDQLICVTKLLLSWANDDYTFYDYLSLTSKLDETADLHEKFMFMSLDGLREHSDIAGCTFDAGFVVQLASLLATYFANVNYHGAVRGCPMDSCFNHDDRIQSLQTGLFCGQCHRALSRTPPLYHSLLSLITWDR